MVPLSIEKDPDSSYDLALGQCWEKALAEHLTSHGWKAYQPKQLIHESGQIRDRYAKALYRGHRRYIERLEESEPIGYLLRPLQLDLVARKGKLRLNLEVKALSGSAFERADIHIGCCEKFDRKEVPIHGVVLINRATGEIWTVPPKAELRRAKSINQKGFDYVVSKASLSPLGAFLDAQEDIRALWQEQGLEALRKASWLAD